ncbi:MAG: YciI family protein [Capsulimonas sp.]|uniref:YciI family protein n=1 Tax=Capsulimonas sp. TaxID=2494211 RepID=UPI003262F98A
MKYLCLVYHEEGTLEALSKSEYDALVDEALAYRDELERGGRGISAHALQPVETAITLRVRNGNVSMTDGPFVETKEQLGGYYLIEATDLNDAIRLASKIPSARLGGIEVRPVQELRPE